MVAAAGAGLALAGVAALTEDWILFASSSWDQQS